MRQLKGGDRRTVCKKKCDSVIRKDTNIMRQEGGVDSGPCSCCEFPMLFLHFVIKSHRIKFGNSISSRTYVTLTTIGKSDRLQHILIEEIRITDRQAYSTEFCFF